MLLVFVLCHLSVFVAANPFHKYPFVFLLDVGNEELEKTNSEQIRVSVPGGSIALRYPAIGYGNTIGHIRVSGIDFGTDLKASIVDGGPGYKYVVLVFVGKPDTPYDAVLTVQTVIDNNINIQNVENIANSEPNTNQSEEDKNDSAEDLSDTDIDKNVQSETYIENNNAELMQSSSNMYSYVNNESVNDTEDDDDSDYNNEEIEGKQVYSDINSEYSVENADFEDVNNAKDIHTQYTDDIDKENPNVQLKSVQLEETDDDERYDGEVNLKTKPSEQQPEGLTDYEDFQEHLNYGNEIYSQEEYQKSSNYQEDPLDYVDPYAEEFNDGVDK
ncbi:unnamed protein product [Arctia plantaginis]|uniref:Uncharacterized protein n=1 Tax=Arctia plantaginis TaxID=874455 RepID=A0A8S1AKQ7_ARCPL|nr:unnamed protein product [Arctia plantaginis]